MNAFDRLDPALQYHIANSLGWRTLRPVQNLAIEGVLAECNLIVIAPTAGGKTEAAFFPLMSRMLAERWSGLSVLYVSPIKALLNNQEHRLSRYFSLVGRRIGVRHGDISRTEKQRQELDPPDCLLTTPESLEVMLVSETVRKDHVFRELRAVVVDEVHAFANDDRGWHLLSVLERIGRIAGRDLLRIGLSATVGNPGQLVEWLSGGSRRERRVVHPEAQQRAVPKVELDYVATLGNAARVIHALHTGEKRLVFCDSRSRVEKLASELRDLGTSTHVSHSSLGVEERLEAERAFASGQDCVIVATSSLELGIDVGDLDRVIQIDAPGTVSSFLQRMGRTGRRPGTDRNCLFLATTRDGLLRAAGLIELWSRGYVEPVSPPGDPRHVLAQQLMALALQERGIPRHEWFSWVRGVSGFNAFPGAEVEAQVKWMLEQEILWEEAGVLWLGRKGEESYGRRNFLELFSVFSTPPLFDVRHGREEIGSVHESTFLFRKEGPAILLLAGRSWRVTDLDWKRRIARVEPHKEPGRSLWQGEGQVLSYKLCQAIFGILINEDVSPHWSQRARTALQEARVDFEWLERNKTTLVASPEGRTEWWTFAGGRGNACLATALQASTGESVTHDNFSVRFKGAPDLATAQRAIGDLLQADPDQLRPKVDAKALQELKFEACLPRVTATRQLEVRMMDVEAVRESLAKPVGCVVRGGG